MNSQPSSRHLPFLRFMAVLTLGTAGTALQAQTGGSLTPPGPPAPTMKTLDQIESRAPISNPRYTISKPGAYYLTGPIVDDVSFGFSCITVIADNVHLDLNGFTIQSTSEGVAKYGIWIPQNGENITICNGAIKGFEAGIYHQGGSLCQIHRVRALENTRGFHFDTSKGSLTGYLLRFGP